MVAFEKARYFLRIVRNEFRAHPLRMGVLGLCILLLVAMEAWESFSSLPAQDWLAINLRQIRIHDPAEFSFAVFGDNKNSHTVFERLLKQVDHDPGIAFAMDLGDLVYDGEKEKYRFFLKQVRENLSLPLLTAIGNHELREKGRGLYYAIFGPFYYSFHIGGAYFIVIDDADEKGLGIWQLRWLEQELRKAQAFQTRFVFMHVPLFDPRGGLCHHCLPEKAAGQLADLFRRYGVTHIFTSHIHGYFSGQWRGVPYTITGGGGAKLVGTDPSHYFYHYLGVRVKSGEVDVQVKRIRSPDYDWLDRLAFIAWLYLYAWIRFHGIEAALLILAGGMLLLTLGSPARKKQT